MFCAQCGAPLEEGSRFCAACGAAQPAPAPAAEPAPAPLLQDEPAHAVEQPQPVIEQPQPVPAPVVEQPQPPYEAAQSPVYPPAPAAPAPRKKRSKKGVVWGIIAAVLAVAVLVCALNFSALANAVMQQFASPRDYFLYLEKKNVEAIAASVADSYDDAVAQVTKTEGARTADLTLSLEEGAYDLLEETGADFSWLEEVGLGLTINASDGDASLEADVSLNGESILTPSLLLDLQQGRLIGRVPEFSSDDVLLLAPDSQTAPGGVSLGQILRDLGELVKRFDQYHPTKEQVKELINRYFTLGLESIDEDAVEKSKETVEAGGISANCTALGVTADGAAMKRMVKTIAREMKSDETLKTVIQTVCKAADADEDEAYEDFLDSLDEMIAAADRFDEFEGKYAMTLYVDGAGNTVGRSFGVITDFGTTENSFLMPRDGDRFGVEISIEQERSTAEISGSGTVTGDRMNATCEIEINGVTLGEFTIQDLIVKGGKDPSVKGQVIVVPNESLLPETLIDPRLIVDLDVTRQQSSVSLTAQLDGQPIATLSAVEADAQAKPVEPADSVLPADQWASQIDLDALIELFDRLTDAGVPAELLQSLFMAVN